MKVIKMERIVKTYYDALEEGKVLGRKCNACGHIEFPPYLACNECGNLDTEWVDLTNTRARILQVLPPLNVFPETEFQNENDGFVAVCIQIENADPYVTSMVHVGKNAYERIHENMENIVLKPCIIQGADTKVCSWVDENYVEESKKNVAAETVSENAVQKPQTAAYANDEITKTIIKCAAEGYDVEESSITLATDIREDLSSESMKMIVMLSNIEEALDVVIEIPEAGSLNTIADFVNTVRAKLGISGSVSAEGAMVAADKEIQNGSANELDDVTKTVITAAAEAYDADEESITPSTDIREDLSSESMKMIVMLSNIEEALDVVIEISEAGALNTIADFAELARKKLG